MGASVTANCPCGFHADQIPIGGGMNNFRELCLFPVLCKSCGEFGVINLFAGRAKPKDEDEVKLPWIAALMQKLFSKGNDAAKSDQPPPAGPVCQFCKSPNILPYDSPELIKRAGNPIETWNAAGELGRVLVLTDGEYRCPKCKEFKMTFKPAGILWD